MKTWSHFLTLRVLKPCTMRLPSYSRILFLYVLSETVWAKTVREEVTITWERGAPNGQHRDMIMMNGQFPGPTFVWMKMMILRLAYG